MASTDALSSLAKAASERTTLAFLNSTEMLDTSEAIAFCRAHARKMIAAALLNVSPSVTLSSLEGTAAPSTPDTGADVPAEREPTVTTPALTSTLTPRSLPAQAPAAEAPLVPEFAPAASGAGPDEPVEARLTTASSTSAPPASAAGSGAESRGRRSLVTKQASAAAALAASSKTLDDDNDGIFVVPAFPVRDIGAGNDEDKKNADEDASSEDESKAEHL